MPTDFSEGSRAAIEYAVSMQEAFGASIVLFHVVERAPYVGPEALMVNGEALEQFARDQSEAELRATVEELRRRGITGVSFALDRGAPADRIVTAAADYDLVVMGTHGRTGLAHLLAGSVAERVVRLAPCPVLCVRAARSVEMEGNPT